MWGKEKISKISSKLNTKIVNKFVYLKLNDRTLSLATTLKILPIEDD